MPLTDALRVSVLEAVDGLVVIADHANCTVRAEIAQGVLLGSIQILIFVNQNVRKFPALRGSRICVQILIEVRNDFID